MGMMIRRRKKIISSRESGVENKLAGDSYNKSDLIRMNKADLQTLAKKTGISGSEEMNATQLKDALAGHFGL